MSISGRLGVTRASPPPPHPTLSKRECRSARVHLPRPVTQLITPAGRPAAAKHCTISTPATDPWVGGLSTSVLPAMSAGPILETARLTG